MHSGTQTYVGKLHCSVSSTSAMVVFISVVVLHVVSKCMYVWWLVFHCMHFTVLLSSQTSVLSAHVIAVSYTALQRAREILGFLGSGMYCIHLQGRRVRQTASGGALLAYSSTRWSKWTIGSTKVYGVTSRQKLYSIHMHFLLSTLLPWVREDSSPRKCTETVTGTYIHFGLNCRTTPELVYYNGSGASDGAMWFPPTLCSTANRESLRTMAGVDRLRRAQTSGFLNATIYQGLPSEHTVWEHWWSRGQGWGLVMQCSPVQAHLKAEHWK